MRAVAPSLRRAGGGVIVNMSSLAGLIAYAGIGAYVAGKWGLRGLTKTAALELAPDGVRVCSVHPGAIRTGMTATFSTGARVRSGRRNPRRAARRPDPRRTGPGVTGRVREPRMRAPLAGGRTLRRVRGPLAVVVLGRGRRMCTDAETAIPVPDQGRVTPCA